MEPTFRTRPSNKWAMRDSEESISSFEAHILSDIDSKAACLIWYVSPNSKAPIWIQILLLWIKMRLFRIKPRNSPPPKGD